jgi:class 3 adenylate cyclase/tetratricopeptide (TPR) repeat protein
VRCSACQHDNQSGANFCSHCGRRLGCDSPAVGEPAEQYRSCRDGAPHASPVTGKGFSHPPDPLVSIESERKHVTVLFSDLTGYTAMSELLDPEEVKDVLNHIFADVSRIVRKYEGYIDKYIGDAVMAIFGVPKAHEDDPLRAVLTALEIHGAVAAASPRVEQKTGRFIIMHTGITTGLIVTDEMDITAGRHGMTGDTINVAARLTSLAGPGEVIVDGITHHRCRGYVDFETLAPVRVKGKEVPIAVYRVRSIKRKPSKVYRVTGLRAELIGREGEMRRLACAYEELKAGGGSLVTVRGDAGTGKSRLVEEFKRTIDRTSVRWFEAHAHAYSQNMPYHLMIDMLSRTLHVDGGRSSETTRRRIEAGIGALPGCRDNVVPYIARLYDIDDPSVRDMSPELWKAGLLRAIHSIAEGVVSQGPVVFYLEDLHWADHSSVAILRSVLTAFRHRALFLCVYRPSFDLVPRLGKNNWVHDIKLRDLPPSEAQGMIESMLQPGNVPNELKAFIDEKVEGNPFYIEEVINTMIESGILACDRSEWRLSGPIDEAEVPTTIHGIVAARIDRLGDDVKRVLQEASVIGRTFPYNILSRVTAAGVRLDRYLAKLERLNVIITKSFYPDLEYSFRHGLTQEVVYNGILLSERRIMHETTARVMEEVFQERRSEFYETFAYHFTRGISDDRAVDYLMKSGEKNLNRYSLDEAHGNYREAYILLVNKQGRSDEDRRLLIDLLIKWAVVYNQRGDYSALIDRLMEHEQDVAIAGRESLGMYYGWLGWSLRQRERLKEAYDYVTNALAMGEAAGSRRVTAYACAWLTQICADRGQLDDAVRFGTRAREFTDLLERDRLFFQFCMVGLGLAYFFRGECARIGEIGEILSEHGLRHGEIRSRAMGHNMAGLSHYAAGDFSTAADKFQSAIDISLDPMISCLSMLFLGMSYLSDQRLQEAEATLEKVIAFNEDFGIEAIGTSAEALREIVGLSRGALHQGITTIEATLKAWLAGGSRYRYATVEHLLGKIYFAIATGGWHRRISLLVRNMGFMITKAPFALALAEKHFRRARTMACEIGAMSIAAQVNLDMGILHRTRGNTEQARQCVNEAMALFLQCGARAYYGKARELLSELEG